MIQALKKRFMMTFMSFFTLLLIGMLLYVYLSSYYSMEHDGRRALEMTINQYNEDEMVVDRGNGLPLFSVGLDEQDKIIEPLGEVFLQEDELREVVDEIIQSGDMVGKVQAYHIRYNFDEVSNRVFIIDMSYQNQRLFSLAVMLIILGVVTLIAFYFLSRYFSNMAILPVKKAWHAQNQFLSNASHELKTPLSIMIANSELLAASEDKNSDKNSQRIGLITEETARMKSLVEEILFLARSDENTYNLQRSVCNLSELVTGCTLMFEPVAFEKGVALSYDVETNLYMSMVEDHIRRLVNILLDNAIKYTPSACKVHLTLEELSDGRNQLKVHNTGVVISDEDIEQIFSRFYKSTSNGVSYTDSYGLGLSIAAKICEDHDGKIKATSSKEDGVTFTAVF